MTNREQSRFLLAFSASTAPARLSEKVPAVAIVQNLQDLLVRTASGGLDVGQQPGGGEQVDVGVFG